LDNAEVREAAQGLFPGGVNSPVRSFRSVGGNPVPIARGEGAHVFDVEGRRYIDYLGAFGPLILGRGTVLCINNRASLTETATPYDIAKVRVDSARARRLPALKFSRWGPTTGLRIRVIGYPGNQWTPVIAEGTISERLQHQVFAFEVNNGIVTRGSSGSPVLTTSGEVVGMVYAEGSGQLFATAVNWVLDTACR